MASEGQQFYISKKRKDRAARGTGSKYRKKSGVYALPAGTGPAGSDGTRESVLQAAAVFMNQARVVARTFSKRIPPATNVVGYGEQSAAVVTDGSAAPNAAPFEFGERHPLFGNTGYWYKQKTRAYMSRAARNAGAIQRAKDVYAQVENDLLASEYGYTE